MEDHTIVETQAREVDGGRNVHWRDVRHELDCDVANVGRDLPDVALRHVEFGLRRARQARLPVLLIAVDGLLGDEAVEGRDGGVVFGHEGLLGIAGGRILPHRGREFKAKEPIRWQRASRASHG